MERLTDYSDDECTYIIGVGNKTCEEFCKNAVDGCKNCYIQQAFKKLADYEDLEDQGLIVRLPCKIGDTVYVDSAILPIEDMECYEDIDNKIPSYFQARVVSFRFAQINWVRIAVKAKWLCEWIDDETGPESGYIECEKKFSILLPMIGKYIFLTREEAEKKLEEMKKND